MTQYSTPVVMGILNVTPDSFSDGGLYLDPGAAIRHAECMAAAGAQIVDVGGESTRPGAEPVPVAEELRRVVPVVEAMAGRVGAVLSVDTSKLPVAEQAIAAGVTMVNDVSAFRLAPELAGLCAERGVDVCLMHMRGLPKTMQEDPIYDDVVADVCAFLEERLAFAIAEGIPIERIVLDPGIGFGKTLEHNLKLLHNLDRIVAIGPPVMVGTSRKSFLGHLTERPESKRLAGTIASCVEAMSRGAQIFRVHDVGPVVDALKVALAIES